MRELTGKPKTNTGYANLNTNEIHLATIYTLDDIGDGATYSRVLTTDITAGHIKLSETIQSASYRTVNDTEKGVWNGKPDDMDELGEGVTYKKVLATQISSGRISLTAANYYSGKFSGEWYSMGTESGVDIDAVTGINIYGKGNALTTRATKTGTIQCYVGTDGAIYAGAGKVKLDAGGVEIIGEFLQVSNPLEDATHWIGAEVNAFARDKDGNVLPCLSDASLIYTGGAWVQRQPAFSFKQWLALAGEIDPYSDTAATLYFITKNKARDANLDHIFAPSVTSHGRLGNATYKWLSAHIDTITPVTIDFPTTDVTDCLDEDDMVSDSATKLATQQSIKAYVDARIWEHIETKTPGDVGTTTFSSLSTAFTFFRLTIVAKSVSSATNICIRFNADSGANQYDYGYLLADGGGVSFAAGALGTKGVVGRLTSAGYSLCQVLIDNNVATENKAWWATTGTRSIGLDSFTGFWVNTADKITSITILADTGTFGANCKFILEGCRK